MTVIYSEEISIISKILQHAAGILTFLLLGSRAHQTGDVHLDSFERIDLALNFVRPLVFLFFLLALTCSEDAQKIHRKFKYTIEVYSPIIHLFISFPTVHAKLAQPLQSLNGSKNEAGFSYQTAKNRAETLKK